MTETPERDDVVGRVPDAARLWTERRISHEEARYIAQRLINSHFHQEPCARVSIPARPGYDDDLLILSYIDQQSTELTRLRSELSSAQARCAAMAEGLNEISDVVDATLMRGDATYGLGQIARCVKKALSNTPARASQLLELEDHLCRGVITEEMIAAGYEVLCNGKEPPGDLHWEGWIAPQVYAAMRAVALSSLPARAQQLLELERAARYALEPGRITSRSETLCTMASKSHDHPPRRSLAGGRGIEMMTIGFLLPNERERLTIAGFRDRIDQLRPDQLMYFEHLLRSWQVFRSRAGLSMVARAYRRTLNDRP